MERLIETDQDRRLFIRFLERQALPFVVLLKSGRLRSYDQNRLQFLWAAEVAAHSGDVTAREVQLEWKMRFAAPILIEEDMKFAALWARADRVLNYAEKMEWVEFVPISSLLTKKGFARYLDDILRYYAGVEGIKLTMPEDMRWAGDATTSARVDRREAKHTDPVAGEAPHRDAARDEVC